MSEAIVVTTTTPTVQAAEALAARLVETRLAACVQIAPIVSIYAWKSETMRGAEQLLTIKTRASLFERVEAAIRAGNEYDVPEVIAVAVSATSADYLAWLIDATEQT